MRWKDQPKVRGWHCRGCGKRTTYTRLITHNEAYMLWWQHTQKREHLTIHGGYPSQAPTQAPKPPPTPEAIAARHREWAPGG